jgi:hypothetical protein
MIKGDRQLRFFLLLAAGLSFGYVTKYLCVLGHKDFAALGLHVHRDLGKHLVTSLHFLGVDRLR